MQYAIWYMRPEFFRNGIMGHDWLGERGMLPAPANLGKTHVHLKNVDAAEGATGLEQIFTMMQGEFWSPNGEAWSLIEEKGLRHTSMSMGDIAVDELGAVYLVDAVGFVFLGPVPTLRGVHA